MSLNSALLFDTDTLQVLRRVSGSLESRLQSRAVLDWSTGFAALGHYFTVCEHVGKIISRAGVFRQEVITRTRDQPKAPPAYFDLKATKHTQTEETEIVFFFSYSNF